MNLDKPFASANDDDECRKNRFIGFHTPLDAYKFGPREAVVYVTCINAHWQNDDKPDILATIDLEPTSPTYSQIIHKLEMPHVGDELHHMGWNACSSCRYGGISRSHLVVPGLNSDRIYIIDTKTDKKAPRIVKEVEPHVVHEVGKASAPHTAHCLPSGNIMISCMGDEKENAKGTFLLLEQATFELSSWEQEGNSIEFNYDYWYQPRHNVMISTEWAAPKTFRRGFDIHDVKAGLYGHHINVWDWESKKRIQRLDLGNDGMIPLEIRFLHDPTKAEGFVGCALSSTIVRFYKTEENSWATETVIKVPEKEVAKWALPKMPGLITDVLISLDDRFLYFSNWLHGDIRQYDISDTKNPKLVGQIFLGGSICKDGQTEVTKDEELEDQPIRPTVKDVPLRGGPQMLQLSLDGKRLYVTNSLFSSWDALFYPENIKQGSMMLCVKVNTEEGGLTLDENFLVEFGPGVLAHEMRLNGGDSTSDIWE